MQAATLLPSINWEAAVIAARAAVQHAEANGWRLYRQTMDETVIEIGHSRAWRREEVLEAANAFVILLLPLLALVVLVARRVVLCMYWVFGARSRMPSMASGGRSAVTISLPATKPAVTPS